MANAIYVSKSDILDLITEENVELKSILNAALKDIHGKNICEVINACKLCAIKFQQLCDAFPWQYANEALKLIGDEPNVV